MMSLPDFLSDWGKSIFGPQTKNYYDRGNKLTHMTHKKKTHKLRIQKVSRKRNRR